MVSTRRVISQRPTKRHPRPTAAFLQVIGSNIFKYRKERGLTQRDIDRLADLSDGYTSELERGKQNPSVGIVEAIAAALEVTESDLVRRPSR